MTPTSIIAAARNKYNAIGDSFWSDEELLGLIYDACVDMNREAMFIERVYSTSTVAGQQEYAYPTDTTTIKRITYNGKKLTPIDFREDDAITGLNQSTASTGTPSFYFIWDETVSLRPIPSDVGTLKIWVYNEPAAIQISSVLEIPTQFHSDIINYLVGEMANKDKEFDHADRYFARWEKAKITAKAFARKKRRGDALAHVKDEESIYE